MVSMFLSPYTSQQSFSAALVFVPSWWSVLLQYFALSISFLNIDYYGLIPVWALLVGLSALFTYRPSMSKATNLAAEIIP
jgi:hypothetical protein